MRLIDADALIEKYCRHCPEAVQELCMKEPVCEVVRAANNAPTVEPEKE